MSLPDSLGRPLMSDYAQLNAKNDDGSNQVHDGSLAATNQLSVSNDYPQMSPSQGNQLGQPSHGNQAYLVGSIPVSQMLDPTPEHENVIYANIEYPVLPEENMDAMSVNPEAQVVEGLDNQRDATTLNVLLQPHPYFKKSNWLTFSHFVIMGTFIYGVMTFSHSRNIQDLLPAFMLEFVLSLILFILRSCSSEQLQGTDHSFKIYEIYPELIRLVSFGLFVMVEYFGSASWMHTVYEKVCGPKTLLVWFGIFYVIGCLSRFNFMHSLFNSSMSNLITSILIAMFLHAAWDTDLSQFPTTFEQRSGWRITIIVCTSFMLFIGTVKVFSTLIHMIFSLFGCQIDLSRWKFFILANLWGLDYFLGGLFIISTCVMAGNSWPEEETRWKKLFKASGWGYAIFYVVYTLANLFLPYFMPAEELDALRNFEEVELDDQVRQNMLQKRRGNNVRAVKPRNNAEKMITLFQVSPFFFSETKAKPTPGQKFAFSSEREASECLICFGQPSQCLISPCLHGGVCRDCSHSILLKNPSCPFCRARIRSIQVIESRGENLYAVKETLEVR